MQMDQERPSRFGCNLTVMKRVSIAFLGVVLLSAWGMPFHPPCCGFRDSARTAIESNCCPVQGCPLAQARGAAPATIARAESLDAAPSAIPFGAIVTPIPRLDLSSLPTPLNSRSSPSRARPTAALLSLFRI